MSQAAAAGPAPTAPHPSGGGGVGRRAADDPATPLPRAAPAELARHLDELVEHVVAAVVDAVPEYSFDGSTIGLIVDAAVRYATGVAGGAEDVAVPGWARSAEGFDLATVDDLARLFRGLGRQEYLMSRPLDRLHASFCAAGRAGWQFLMGHIARREGLAANQLHRGADAIFVTVEHISVYAAEGYTEASSAVADDTTQARERLLSLLLSAPCPTVQAVRLLAGPASWTVPDDVMVVILEDDGDGPVLLDPDVLQGDHDGHRCLVVPVRPGRDREVSRALHRCRATVGPSTPARRAGESWTLARRATDLRRRGVFDHERILWCTDHLVDMLVLSDPLLLEHLIRRSLTELGQVGERQRVRLAGTLLAWLRLKGNTPGIADELGVHPQTVRYRMAQLRELYGDRLDDPRDQLATLLALTGCRLRGLTADPDEWPEEAHGRA